MQINTLKVASINKSPSSYTFPSPHPIPLRKISQKFEWKYQATEEQIAEQENCDK